MSDLEILVNCIRENDDLRAQLAVTWKALVLACEFLEIVLDICPADMDSFNGNCDECEHKSIVRCWEEHYLDRAKAGDQIEPIGQD